MKNIVKEMIKLDKWGDINIDDIYDHNNKNPIIHEIRLTYINLMYYDINLYNKLYESISLSMWANKKNDLICICKYIYKDDWLYVSSNILVLIIINLLNTYTYKIDKKIILQKFIDKITSEYIRICNNIIIIYKIDYKIKKNIRKKIYKIILYNIDILKINGIIKEKRVYKKNKIMIILIIIANNEYKYLYRQHNILLYAPTIKKWNNTYIIGGKHYMNNYNIMNNNKYNNYNIIINKKYIKFIEKYSNIYVYIDKIMVKNINKIYNIDTLDKSIKNVKELLNYGEYDKKKINILYKNSKYTNFKKFISNNCFGENIDINIKKLYDEYNEYNDNYRKIQSKYSKEVLKIIYITYINYIINYNDKIYFIPFSDFRGRNYHRSEVSPYNSKLFRFLYNYGVYDNINGNNQEILIEYSNLIDDYNFPKKYMQHVLWILLSIGMVLKNNIKYDYYVKYDELILLGYNQYKGLNNYNVSNDDMIEIKYYIEIINECVNDKIIHKRYIMKDSTASIFQHLTKILGISNIESLKYLNLINTNVWYDTYKIFINKIFEKNKLNKLNYLITRKILKNVIMTHYYSASYVTSKKYFFNNVRLEYGNDFIKKNSNEMEQLILNIYKNLDNIELFFYKTTVKKFIIMIKKYNINEKHEFILEDIIIDLKYYNSGKIRHDFMYNKKRKTVVMSEKNMKINYRKTYNALIPNIAHALDALYVRLTLKEMDNYYYVIHDAFMVDFYNIEKIVNIAKTNMNINQEYYLYQIYTNPNNDNQISIKITSNSIII